ncbi:MAG: peptidylprolyl isomerase [Gammaproteobacteria bacterium]|nr:peptidylprolyl isomerase [Gammaproteobacteria bacterium]
MNFKTDRSRAPHAAGLLVLLCLLAVPLWAAPPADGVLLDRIAALVNEDVITHSELESRLQQVARNLPDGRLPPREVLRRQVLDRMIIERLQLQFAEQIGIRIDDGTLNRTMQEIAQGNNLSLPAFREQLLAEGIDYDDFREQIRDEMTITRLRQRQVDSRVSVSDREIDDFIASQAGAVDRDVEYRLSHILVSVPEAASPEDIRQARDRAQALRTRIVEQGEDFEQVAIAESDGQNALQGGDLGWRPSGRLPSLFSRPVTLMEIGDVSELIRSPSGFHLIRLADRRGGQQSSVLRTHARHILIRPSAVLTSTEAREQLLSLKRRIEGGESFADLARANSQDPGSARQGGDLGWADPGQFVAEFEEVMNALEPGQISEPFQSPFGWHILEVIERRQHDNTREQLRARAREYIRDRKREEELEVWLRRMRDEAYVELRLDDAPLVDTRS